MTIYVLKLSSGTYNEYREEVIGVFSSEEKVNKAKVSAEAQIQKGIEATFKDTSWRYPSCAEEWGIDELSKEDEIAWYDFIWKKSALGDVNQLWAEPFILDQNDFALKDLI